MPGYYDWKIRNCTDGAVDKARSLRETMEMVDNKLHTIWDNNGGKFPKEINDHLAAVVTEIDTAEDALERGKLLLAELFSGHPKADPDPDQRRK